MKTEKVIAMELPNGSRIEIEHTEGKFVEKDGIWETVNVNLHKIDGFTHTICAFDFDGSTEELKFSVLDENGVNEESFTLLEKNVIY